MIMVFAITRAMNQRSIRRESFSFVIQVEDNDLMRGLAVRFLPSPARLRVDLRQNSNNEFREAPHRCEATLPSCRQSRREAQRMKGALGNGRGGPRDRKST